MRGQWGAVWVDWPEPRLPFNVFKSFCAVVLLSLCASTAIYLLCRLVSSSMKNGSYTGIWFAREFSGIIWMHATLGDMRQPDLDGFSPGGVLAAERMWHLCMLLPFCSSRRVAHVGACVGSLFNVTGGLFVLRLCGEGAATPSYSSHIDPNASMWKDRVRAVPHYSEGAQIPQLLNLRLLFS